MALNILDKAYGITGKGGDRRKDYGHPYHDLKKTAAMWSGILGTELTPQQVCLCMIALKVSRQAHRHKEDNLVDICGYARCIEMIEEYLNEHTEVNVANVHNTKESDDTTSANLESIIREEATSTVVPCPKCKERTLQVTKIKEGYGVHCTHCPFTIRENDRNTLFINLHKLIKEDNEGK